MSDFPFSIPRRGDADVVNGVSYAGTTLTLTRAEGSDLTTTIAAGDPTKIENGNSSMEIASANGDCVFTPNGDAALATTFAADGDIITSGDIIIPQVYAASGASDKLLFKDNTGGTVFGNAGINFVGGPSGTENDGSRLSFFTNDTARLSIIKNGNVGIGDDAPDAPLQIKGDGSNSSSLRIESTNAAGAGYMYIQRNPDGKSYILNATNHPLLLGANNDTNQLYLKGDGNVGINDTSPGEKLAVGGNISLTGGLNIGGTQANGDAIKLTGSNPRIVNTTGFLALHSDDNIEFETDQNGDNGGAEYKFFGRASTGTTMSQRMNLNGGTGNLQIQGVLTQSHNFSDDRLKTDEAYLENATESIGKLSVQTYNKEQLLNFNLLERTGETVSEVGLIAQEVYYNAPEFRNLIETGYNKTYDASYTTYEDVSHTIWDGDVSNTTVERVSRVVPKKLKTSTKIIPSEMDLSGVPIGEDPDYEAAGWSKEQPASVNYQGFIPYLIKSIQELAERLAALENK